MLTLISALLLSFFSVTHAQEAINQIPTFHYRPQPADPVELKVSMLSRSAKEINPKVLSLAIDAYYHAKARGEVAKPLLTVIDYSLKSSLRRLWVFDMQHNKLLYHTHVSHGKGTGNLYAKNFSNRAGSHQSSLGVYVTGKTYTGDKGLSLRLNGREKGVNDKARSRAIVMHGAWYTNANFIKQNGYAGRSWGCPAIPTKYARPILNTIKKGSLVFAYFPNQQWLSHSKYLT